MTNIADMLARVQAAASGTTTTTAAETAAGTAAGTVGAPTGAPTIVFETDESAVRENETKAMSGGSAIKGKTIRIEGTLFKIKCYEDDIMVLIKEKEPEKMPDLSGIDFSFPSKEELLKAKEEVFIIARDIFEKISEKEIEAPKASLNTTETLEEILMNEKLTKKEKMDFLHSLIESSR